MIAPPIRNLLHHMREVIGSLDNDFIQCALYNANVSQEDIDTLRSSLYNVASKALHYDPSDEALVQPPTKTHR
jgi:hypothetical protein